MPGDTVVAFAMALMSMREKEMEDLRRTGRTTRLVDQYIQDLFNNPGKWIVMQDHHDNGNKHLFRIINRRLAIEHQEIYTSDLIEAKEASCMIRLICDPAVLAKVNKRMTGE